jgi:hypothetical protein
MFATAKRVFLVIAFAVLLVPTWVGATGYGIDQTANTAGIGPESGLKFSTQTIPNVIGDVVGVILSLVGVAFFLLALYAGFIWMSARGNSERVDKAKDILEAAVIGLIIIVGAYALTKFVFERLGFQEQGAPPPATTVEKAPGVTGVTLPGVPTAPAGTDAACIELDGVTVKADGASCGANMDCSGGLCKTECELEKAAQNGRCEEVGPAGSPCANGRDQQAGLCPGKVTDPTQNVCCFDPVI